MESRRDDEKEGVFRGGGYPDIFSNLCLVFVGGLMEKISSKEKYICRSRTKIK